MVIADKAVLPAEPELGRKTATGACSESQAFRALAGGLTPLDGRAAAECLSRAWHSEFGESVPGTALDLLWAQWALETARGRAMHGNNFGGIKAQSGGALLETSEGHGARAARVKARFRTYRSADDGARDHVGLLARRYPGAIEAARRGDAAAFVSELSRGGYFTASENSYRAGIERLVAERRGLVSVPHALAKPLAPLIDGVLERLKPRVRRG